MAKTSTRSKKATPRSTGKARAARKSAEPAPVTSPAGPAGPDPEDAAADPVKPVRVLAKRELIDRVVAASGIRKKHAKPVVEAMLKELGDALSREETLNLQPFGTASIKRSKDAPNAEVIELRLRRSKQAVKAAEEAAGTTAAEDGAGSGADPLAKPAE